MSYPTEADFALIKMGDGATPTEVFTIICGVKDVSVNSTANTNDRFVRDCAKPGAVPKRKVRVTGTQQDVSGSGLIDKTQIAKFMAALGNNKNYKVELYIADGTDTGTLMGTFAGSYMMTAANLQANTDSDSSAEITLASNGDFTWTAAA